MATVTTANTGKTEFVKEVLGKNPRANPKTVNDQWKAAGQDGTISATLVNKLRASLGLSGNLRPTSKSITRRRSSDEQPGAEKKRGSKPKKDSTKSILLAASRSNGSRAIQPARQNRTARQDWSFSRLHRRTRRGHRPAVVQGDATGRTTRHRGELETDTKAALWRLFWESLVKRRIDASIADIGAQGVGRWPQLLLDALLIDKTSNPVDRPGLDSEGFRHWLGPDDMAYDWVLDNVVGHYRGVYRHLSLGNSRGCLRLYRPARGQAARGRLACA